MINLSDNELLLRCSCHSGEHIAWLIHEPSDSRRNNIKGEQDDWYLSVMLDHFPFCKRVRTGLRYIFAPLSLKTGMSAEIVLRSEDIDGLVAFILKRRGRFGKIAQITEARRQRDDRRAEAQHFENHQMPDTTNITPSTRRDMPAILRDLRLNAIEIVAWTEALVEIPDQDLPAALAVIEYLEALLDREINLVFEFELTNPQYLKKHPQYLKEDMRFEHDEYLTPEHWHAVEATLSREKIAAVDRCIDELWQQSCLRLGNSTARPER